MHNNKKYLTEREMWRNISESKNEVMAPSHLLRNTKKAKQFFKNIWVKNYITSHYVWVLLICTLRN